MAGPRKLKRGPVPAHVREFVQEHHTLTLATCAKGGRPWAAAVFYVCDEDLGLHFMSSPSTRHSLEIASSPDVSATIQAHDQEWRDLRGVQLEGIVSVVPADDRVRVETLYLCRFPALSRLLASPCDADERAVSERFAQASFYTLRPHWLRFIDNRRGFGHRDEWKLGGR